MSIWKELVGVGAAFSLGVISSTQGNIDNILYFIGIHWQWYYVWIFLLSPIAYKSSKLFLDFIRNNWVLTVEEKEKLGKLDNRIGELSVMQVELKGNHDKGNGREDESNERYKRHSLILSQYTERIIQVLTSSDSTYIPVNSINKNDLLDR